MAAFLCKKCAHKTLPISITTFHFQFAVLPFCRFHANPPPPPPSSLLDQKKRETLTGELGFERRPREMRTANWELSSENRELGASVRSAAAGGSSSSCCSGTPPWTLRPLRRTAFRCLVISLLLYSPASFFYIYIFCPTPQCTTGERKFIKMLIFPAEI